MKTLVLYDGSELVHQRNPYGSHSWVLTSHDDSATEAEDEFWSYRGNVAVANEILRRWPEDRVIAALVGTMDLGDHRAAQRGLGLGEQRYLSIGRRCRELQVSTGCLALRHAKQAFDHPRRSGRRGARS